MAGPDLDKVLERTDGVVADVVADAAASVDASASWPGEGLRAMQEAGLGGLVVPERAGGLGHGLTSVLEVTQRLGQACASTAMCFGMHLVGSAVIAAKATEAQTEELLEPIARGKHLTTLALSEPGSGSNFWYPSTTIEASPDGYVVNGRKSFVTNGGRADSYVVSVVADADDAPVGEFSCVAVEAGAAGLHWDDEWNGVGMRGNSSRNLELHDVAVPPYALLGAAGDQIWYVFNVVAPYFLVAMAGTYLGVAAAALEEARLHVAERRFTHDGSRLSQQPYLQHRLGSLWADVERTRQLCRFAAAEFDRGEAAGALPALCSAKAEVADCATRVIDGAMTMLGGIGYRYGGAMDRHLRDARAAHVMSPTTDVLRQWVGRILLGEHLLAD